MVRMERTAQMARMEDLEETGRRFRFGLRFDRGHILCFRLVSLQEDVRNGFTSWILREVR